MNRWLILIAFSFLCMHPYGQLQQLIPLTHFGELGSKPIANVRCILNDKYGLVWIATQDGLIRYDGRNDVVYNRNTGDTRHHILNNDIDGLIEEPGMNCLWVINSYAGLSKIDLVTGEVLLKVRLFTSNNQSVNSAFAGFEYQGGKIYVLTDMGYLFTLETGTGKVSGRNLLINQPAARVQRFCMLNNKFLVCLSDARVLVFNEALTRVESQMPVNHATSNFRFITSAAAGEEGVLLGTSEGVKKLYYDNAKKNIRVSGFGNPAFDGEKVKTILVENGAIWVAYNSALVKYTAGNPAGWQYLNSKGYEENKWLASVTYMAIVANQVWAGSEYGIAVIKKDPAFAPYYQDQENSVKLNHCFSFFSQNDTSVFVCTAEGFFEMNYKKGMVKRMGKSGYYISCFAGPDHDLFVSGFGGSWVKTKNDLLKISVKYPSLSGLDREVIIAAASFADSLYFFAGILGNGLYIYNKTTKKTENINTGSSPVSLKSDAVKKLFVENDTLWIICDNLVSLYDIRQRTIRHFSLKDPVTDEALNILKDVCKVKEHYYFAVYGAGVVVTDKNLQVKKIYSTADGIQNVNLYKIFSIGDSLLITSSNQGLYTINLNNSSVRAYFEKDGLHGSAFEELSGLVYKQNIFMGGINGFTVVHPENLKPATVPPVLYINRALIDMESEKSDTSNLFLSRLEVSEQSLQVNIYFSAVNFSNPGGATFAYRIREQGDNWVNLAEQNFLTLIGLSPGTYHLQVKAANEDGVWSEPKELILVFLPKWYQTWWFYTLIVLAVAGILYGLYRYRISQIKKQHEIRKNIATDLHDDLGSTLNSVKVFTNLAISGINQNESLQQVKDNLTEATMSLRDMIWVLDDSLDTVDELVTRLKQFAIPVTTASDMEFVITAGSGVNNRTLTKEEKRNLFLICKEAINNSIKYSGASQISVNILPAGKKIQITIADNGKGFDETTVKKGYGLQNMQYRAGQVGYKVLLDTAPVKGTKFTVSPA